MTSRRSRRRTLEQKLWAVCEPCILAHVGTKDSDLAQLRVEKISFLFVVFLIEVFTGKSASLASVVEMEECLQLTGSLGCDDSVVRAFVDCFIMQDDVGILKVFHSVGSDHNPLWNDLSAATQTKLLQLYECIALCFCGIVLRHHRIASRSKDALLKYGKR